MDATVDQWVALVLGVLACFYSVRVAITFFKLPTHVGRLLAWQLLSEAYLSMATLAFTAGALTGCIESWPEWFQSMLRISMFGFAGMTTWRLDHYSKTK